MDDTGSVIPGPWKPRQEDLPTNSRVVPSRHLRIPPLVPWRPTNTYHITLCGIRKGKIRFTDSPDDTTCAGCLQRMGLLGMVLESPLTQVREAIRIERDPRQLSAEFWALGVLAERYREEFTNLVGLRMTLLQSQDVEELDEPKRREAANEVTRIGLEAGLDD